MLDYVAVEKRPGRPALSTGLAVLAAERHRVDNEFSRACNAAAGAAGKSLLGVMAATQFSGGGDVQRNLLRILVATSRSWGLMDTKLTPVAHPGLRWAW